VVSARQASLLRPLPKAPGANDGTEVRARTSPP
jgi:hypothetical protein